MDKKALEEGRKYEKHIAARLGGKLVPGSGNQWHSKLDLGARKFVFSAKWTGLTSFKITKALVDEIRAPIVGPGGLGPDWTGALVIHVGGVDYAVLALDDLIGALKDDVRIVPVTKLDEKRARASRLTLLDIE